MKVLIVDDEDDVREVVQLSLGRVGRMDVTEASSGREAVAAAVAVQPDFILLDMMMPGMDGPATLQALRDQDSTSRIPIIFLTAKAMPSEIERLMQLGAAGVVTKPFNPMTLASELRSILGRE